MAPHDGSYGRAGFVERHGLRSTEAARQADELIKRIDTDGLETLRVSFADQHGILRGKTVMAHDAAQIMRNGCAMTSTLLTKDTSHRTVYPVWSADGGMDMAEMAGAGDFIMVPDPATFRVLPWLEKTGWVQCDIYFPNGEPVPFCTRRLCRTMLGDLAGRGLELIAGLEVEFHLFRLEDAKLAPEDATQPATPPDVSLLAHGFQYLTEARMDQLEPALEILRRNLVALDLPLRSIEVEFGPSQCEFTFHPEAGLACADTMILLRSAVKQIARRNGLHATFMCRPHLPNLFSSGWHFHQSLADAKTGANRFMPDTDGDACHPWAGTMSAACWPMPGPHRCSPHRPSTATNATSPSRSRPDRAVWGADNKGTMIRCPGRCRRSSIPH